METRIYQVTGPLGVKMIRAGSQTQAKNHYIGNEVTAEVAKQDDLVDFLSEEVDGVRRRVETAGEVLEGMAG